MQPIKQKYVHSGPQFSSLQKKMNLNKRKSKKYLHFYNRETNA